MTGGLEKKRHRFDENIKILRRNNSNFTGKQTNFENQIEIILMWKFAYLFEFLRFLGWKTTFNCIFILLISIWLIFEIVFGLKITHRNSSKIILYKYYLEFFSQGVFLEEAAGIENCLVAISNSEVAVKCILFIYFKVHLIYLFIRFVGIYSDSIKAMIINFYRFCEG